jgi:hypothetical protein
MMCMLSNNNIGKQVRNYYLDLEKIFKKYLLLDHQYQLSKNIKECNANIFKNDIKYNSILMQNKRVLKELQNKHNSMLKKQKYHTFMIGPCVYIWSDPDSSVEKYKIGYTKNINERLKDFRTSVPNLVLNYLVFSHKAALLETNILSSFEDDLIHANHEIVSLQLDFILDKIKQIMIITNIPYTECNQLNEYNTI